MKSVYALMFVYIFMVFTAYAQSSCCIRPAVTDQFAQLADDKQFINAHLEPMDFTLSEPAGKDIVFKTPDGKEAHAYEIKAKQNSHKVLFVIHEWWGLNDYIKQESDNLSKELNDVTVIALDMYDRKIASNRDSAGKYMQAVSAERGEGIIKGALAYVGSDAHVATIGWCFGGGWSLPAALLAGSQASACIMYYGMPEEKQERLKNLQAPVMFVFAEKDQWITTEILNRFQQNMKETKKILEVKKYNADHAFANPSNPHYNKDFSTDAFLNSLRFIRNHLK